MRAHECSFHLRSRKREIERDHHLRVARGKSKFGRMRYPESADASPTSVHDGVPLALGVLDVSKLDWIWSTPSQFCLKQVSVRVKSRVNTSQRLGFIRPIRPEAAWIWWSPAHSGLELVKSVRRRPKLGFGWFRPDFGVGFDQSWTNRNQARGGFDPLLIDPELRRTRQGVA